MLNKLLDASIVFSFDRTGFRRHAREFQASSMATNLSGRIAVQSRGQIPASVLKPQKNWLHGSTGTFVPE